MSVDVDVRIDGVETAAPAAAPVASIAPPAFALPAPAALVEMPAGSKPLAHRALFEIGGMFSPMTVGLETELAVPLSPQVRLGVIGAANTVLWDSQHEFVWLAAGEVRFVGTGASHNDLGFVSNT